MTDQNNIILLQQLKNGSYKAFEELYAQYFDLLYGFVFGLSRSHQQTKELVQDTFIKVWVHHEKIDLNLSFKAWIYKIAKNQLLDEVKKQLRAPLFEDYLNYSMDEKMVVNSNKNSLDFEEFKKSLINAKKKLSPQQVKVFEYCKEDGLTAVEVAKKLNISEQATYNYLSQSLKILRKALDPYYSLFLLFFID